MAFVLESSLEVESGATCKPCSPVKWLNLELRDCWACFSAADLERVGQSVSLSVGRSKAPPQGLGLLRRVASVLQAQKLGARSMQPRAFDDQNDVWTVLLIFPLYSCHLREACLKTLPPATCLLLHQWTWGFVPTLV